MLFYLDIQARFKTGTTYKHIISKEYINITSIIMKTVHYICCINYRALSL